MFIGHTFCKIEIPMKNKEKEADFIGKALG